MSTRTGIGYSENTKSRNAGEEAARQALERSGITDPDLVMVFFTSKQDPTALRDGIRSVVGKRTKIVGGAACGVITNEKLGYEGYQIGLAAIKSDTVKFDLFVQEGLDKDPREVGVRLAEQIKRNTYDHDASMLLFYDSVKAPPSKGLLNLNFATPIIEGMHDVQNKWPPAAGIGTLGDMQFNPTKMIFNDEIKQNVAIALMIHGGAKMDTIVMHGCRPSGSYHTITKAEGPVIYEIDGKPALDVIAELLGPGVDKTFKDYPLFVTLGVNFGDKFGDFREEDYSNRLCVGVDPERKSILLLEPDLKVGQDFQLMRRDINFDYMRKRTALVLDRVKDRKPFFAWYIDCAGRASAFCGSNGEDATVIQEEIGKRMPLLGSYSGVELAKIGTREMMALDWTGVLNVLSE